MNREKIHIVMAADEAYWKGLEVAKNSMIASCSEPERLEFHLFEDKPGLTDRIRHEFGTYKGSPMAFLRLYLGELLPDVDWVVYSDVDTLWYRDVIELWSLRDESKTIQWVQDIPSAREETYRWQHSLNEHFDKELYGCSGVMLFNLRRFREERGLEKAIEFTRKHGLFKYVDQDILNALYHGKCRFLPECWDVVIPTPENVSGGCVLHLVGGGRCFTAPYRGRIVQYKYWESVAKGVPFSRPWALPFYMRDWMIRILCPFASVFMRDRIRRNLAWRYFLRRFVNEGAKGR
jgi:lipopolysaccharide biosynthesis glycosyltransferase